MYYTYDKKNLRYTPHNNNPNQIGWIIIAILILILGLVWINKAGVSTGLKYNDNHIDYDTINVKVTVYNPIAAQCDSTPYITASNYRIPKDYSKTRTCAVSRDLLFFQFNFFDTIKVFTGDISIDGYYTIVDVMAPNKLKQVDLLSYKSTGKWDGKIIYKK